MANQTILQAQINAKPIIVDLIANSVHKMLHIYYQSVRVFIFFRISYIARSIDLTGPDSLTLTTQSEQAPSDFKLDG